MKLYGIYIMYIGRVGSFAQHKPANDEKQSKEKLNKNV